MLRFHGHAPWAACAILISGFVTAEDLVGAGARLTPRLRATSASNGAATSAAAAAAVPTKSPAVTETPVLIVDEDAVRRTSRPRKIRRTCRVTAYCDRGRTAAGVLSGVGQCAAPGDIPFGSQVYIPELARTFVVTDRTHRRFRHNTVDIFMPSKSVCRKFGRRYLECEFTIEQEPPAYGQLRLPSGQR